MLCGTDGVLYLADPNNFGGTVYFRAKGSDERIPLPPAFGFAENSRGLGVAEMAWSMLSGRKPRANKEMAYHALEILHGIAISDASGENYALKSTFEKMPQLRARLLPALPGKGQAHRRRRSGADLSRAGSAGGQCRWLGFTRPSPTSRGPWALRFVPNGRKYG